MSKIAFITGGTSGIGNAICKVLTSNGYTVYGTGRKVQNGDRLDGFELVQLDVTSDESVRSAISYVIEKEGKIDVLINNAGIGFAGAIEDTSVDEIRKVFETNIEGVVRVCQEVIPYMRKQRFGYIVNITSLGAVIATPYRGIYCASKAAVEVLSESMSMELQQFGIRVTMVEPGDVKTAINENREVAESIEKNVYNDHFNKVYQIINEEVNNGDDPKKIGNIVLKVIQKKNPKLRYNAGGFQLKLAVFAKRVISTRWFERIIMNHFKMNRN